MEDEHTAKQLFYGELANGKRMQCNLKNKNKEDIRIIMKSLGIDQIKFHRNPCFTIKFKINSEIILEWNENV